MPSAKKRVSSSVVLSEEHNFNWDIDNLREKVELGGNLIDIKFDFEAGHNIGLPTQWEVFLHKISSRQVDIRLKLLKLPENVLKVYATFEYESGGSHESLSSPREFSSGEPTFCFQHAFYSLEQVVKSLFFRPSYEIKVKFTLYNKDVDDPKSFQAKRVKLDSESVTAIASDLQSLLDSGENSDVTLEMPDGQLKAHMAILTARSPVFAAMFRNKMTESLSGIVNIDDISTGAMKIILQFIYSGTMGDKWEEWIEEMIYTAEKYTLLDLKERCDLTLATTCTPSNVWNLMDLAKLHGLNTAQEEIDSYVIANIGEIIQAKNSVAAVAQPN